MYLFIYKIQFCGFEGVTIVFPFFSNFVFLIYTKKKQKISKKNCRRIEKIRHKKNADSH